MYRYTPQEPKRREAAITLTVLILSIATLAASKIPDILFPTLLQLVGLCLLAAFLLLTLACLLSRYTYCIEPRDDGIITDVPDFVILYQQGKRIGTVCRISVSDVESVAHITRKKRRALAKATKGRRIYHYTDRINPPNLYLLTVRDGERRYAIRIVADERLLSYFPPANE